MSQIIHKKPTPYPIILIINILKIQVKSCSGHRSLIVTDSQAFFFRTLIIGFYPKKNYFYSINYKKAERRVFSINSRYTHSTFLTLLHNTQTGHYKKRAIQSPF
ncbi:hypothetical protein IX84_29025 [Phaeodactylibacter xiamenensis]|uniref:Uncharacterized protein n=1 Tax=Phaeodactylibacter xiamenensis TaxID=1524460 RepID=A0A098RYY6_9BACT|nr:hypothetical protein IX84_29025 [Phaeodactylibacter xiamenensis]